MKDDKARAFGAGTDAPRTVARSSRSPNAPSSDGGRGAAAPGSARSEAPRSAPAPVADDGTVAGLECRVGKAPILLPVEHVAQIIELEVSPLPLARRWITGIGLHEDRLVMTVGLMPDGTGAPNAVAAPEARRRRTKGILLTTPEADVAWALEVQEVLVLVRATVVERRRTEPRTGDLPPWIGRARTADNRSIAWIDIPSMLSDLATPPRALA